MGLVPIAVTQGVAHAARDDSSDNHSAAAGSRGGLCQGVKGMRWGQASRTAPRAPSHECLVWMERKHQVRDPPLMQRVHQSLPVASRSRLALHMPWKPAPEHSLTPCVQQTTLRRHLVYAKHCSKCFVFVYLFNPYNNPSR